MTTSCERRQSTDRGENEERMVRFGYYAHMAGARWDEGHGPGMPQMLKDSGYDVQTVLREISAWCYGPGREIATAFDHLATQREDDDLPPFRMMTTSRGEAR